MALQRILDKYKFPNDKCIDILREILSEVQESYLEDEIEARLLNRPSTTISDLLLKDIQKELTKNLGKRPKPVNEYRITNYELAITLDMGTELTLPIDDYEDMGIDERQLPDENYFYDIYKYSKVLQDILSHYKETFEIIYDVPTGPEYLVGRIFIDDDRDIFLVTMKDILKLKLDRVESYALFSGLHVLIKGVLSQKEVYVEEIKYEKGLCYPGVQQFEQAKTLVAFGPFTSTGEYSKFIEFLKHANQNYQNLILAGPFVDVENSLVNEGRCEFAEKNLYDLSFVEMFQQIMDTVEEFTRDLNVYIVPSLREAMNHLPLPLKPPSVLKPRLNVLTNPKSLVLNGVKIEIIAYDVIREIIKSYCISSTRPVNKIAFAIEQMISQGSSLPVYPSDLPLEISFYEYFLWERRPHVILTTSALGLKTNLWENVLTMNVKNFAAGVAVELCVNSNGKVNANLLKIN